MKNITLIFCVMGIFLMFSTTVELSAKVDTKKIAEKLEKAINSHDPSGIASCYTEDAKMSMPGELEPVKGKNAIGENQMVFIKAFPDYKIKFLLVLISKNNLVIEWEWAEPTKGPWPPPKEISLPPAKKSNSKV